MASRSSSILMRRSSGPTQSGWRLAERWSMPGGRVRMAATRSLTFWPSSMPPPPGLAPWPMTISMASAWREVGGIEAVAGGQAPGRRAGRRPCAPRGSCPRRRWWSRCPTSVAARPSASLAVADSAPKLMPAMVMGMSSSIGLAPWRLPSTVGSRSAPGSPRAGSATTDAVRKTRSSKVGSLRRAPETADGVLAGVGHLVDPGDDLGREAVVGRA